VALENKAGRATAPEAPLDPAGFTSRLYPEKYGIEGNPNRRSGVFPVIETGRF
jgi:hypothetical protein